MSVMGELVAPEAALHPIGAVNARAGGRRSARFWLNLQTAYELGVAEREIGPRVAEEVRPASVAA
ncbi:MAG TPA: hypothetical protein VGF71_13835 [Caulobacteraceae bacterium]